MDYDGDGRYLVEFFIYVIFKLECNISMIFSVIRDFWRGIVLLSIELFISFVVLYIIYIKKRLMRFWILYENEVYCMFCRKEVEFNFYIFIYCECIRYVLGECLK